MTSPWTHAICASCWAALHPDREPIRVTDAPLDTCCYCGNPSTSGIYVRADPTTTPCHGAGALHEESEA